jgi:hypothetical protein
MLLDRIELHKMPVSELAIVATRAGIKGTSKTKLNEYFREASAMPNDTAEQMWALWREIEQLIVAALPLALDLRDGARVWGWLEAQRKDEIFVKVVTPPPAPTQAVAATATKAFDPSNPFA